MEWRKRIVLDPNVLLGKPVVKGTRLAVEFIVGLLAEGWSEEEILRNYRGSPAKTFTHVYSTPARFSMLRGSTV